MMESRAPVLSFIKGENIRPEVNYGALQSEISVGEKSYYANQGVFSTLRAEDLSSSDLSPDGKIFMEELP